MSHLVPPVLGYIATVGAPSADGEFLVATSATAFAWESGATVRTSLGLAIGSDVQAFGDVLDDLVTLGAPTTDGEIIVATGAGAFAYESGATARTSLGLGTGDAVTFTDLTLTGDLVVQGTTFTVDSETVLLNDNFVDLNAGYTTAAAQAGGITVNYLPTATADTSSTGGFATTTTITTAGSATFSAGDLIAIWDADNVDNRGYFEVASHSGTTLTIDGTPQEDFTKSAFVVDAADTDANITKVNVAALRFNTSGDFQTAKGATVPLSWSTISSPLGSNNTWTGTQDFQDQITTEAVFRDVRTVNGAVTLDATDHHIVAEESGGGDYVITLPAATGSGRVLIIGTTATADIVTVDGSGAETIDGAANTALQPNTYASVSLIDYASGAWKIF